MDFKLSEELVMIQDSMRRIAREQFAPRAAEIDSSERFPWENFEILRDNGFLGINVAEEYGGTGAGQLALLLAVE